MTVKLKQNLALIISQYQRKGPKKKKKAVPTVREAFPQSL